MRRWCCSLLLLVSIGDGLVLMPPPRPSATGTRGFCRLNALGGGTRVAPWRRRARFAAAAVSPSLAAAAGGDGEGRGAAVRRVLDGATSLFPLWVFGAAVLGAARPELLARFASPRFLTPALGATMVAMGMTLTLGDLTAVARRPAPVALGVAAQFSVMPSAAWACSRLWGLDGAAAAGVILVGCCPGGTASNLVTLIGGGDVALSVAMTSVSTALAVVATPLLASKLVGSLVVISPRVLFLSTAQLVLGPVALGILLNRALPPRATAALGAVTPLASVVTVALICGSIVAETAATAAAASAGGGGGALAAAAAAPMLPLVGALLSMHALGFGLGYAAAAAARQPRTTRRTVAIEVGMQNSALAVVLATRAIGGGGGDARVAGAISATAHSCMGSALAALWRRRDSQRSGK